MDETMMSRGLLTEPPDPVVLEYIYRPRLKQDEATLPYLTEANLAHVVMLCQTGIIGQADARALLAALLRIDAEGQALLELDANLEGLYYNYEQFLIRELGVRVGGRLHTGRSRNDLGATMSRMAVRDRILELLDRVMSLRSTLLGGAQRHLTTLITGYTHLQPAQPITMGFYLAAIEQALQRDTARLFHTYQNTNQSCLGAGALAGTGFPIDRQLVADLLGFDGFVDNALDAVATRDYLLELFSDLAILATTLSRVAQDLFVWCSYEFGLVQFPGSLGASSSIMPQKRNPILLESSKGRLSHVFGGLVSALSAMKNTHYTNVIDVNNESFHLLEDSVYQVRATLELLGVAVEQMKVNQERCYALAAANFATATELADLLVRDKDYSFREAHHLVACVVRQALQQQMRASEITSAFVDQVATAEFGATAGLAEERVRQALDPIHNVGLRAHPGGPAPNTVSRAITHAQLRLEGDRRELEELRARLEAAHRSLYREAGEIIGA